jgi:hypothetical protein
MGKLGNSQSGFWQHQPTVGSDSFYRKKGGEKKKTTQLAAAQSTNQLIGYN